MSPKIERQPTYRVENANYLRNYKHKCSFLFLETLWSHHCLNVNHSGHPVNGDFIYSQSATIMMGTKRVPVKRKRKTISKLQ